MFNYVDLVFTTVGLPMNVKFHPPKSAEGSRTELYKLGMGSVSPCSMVPA